VNTGISCFTKNYLRCGRVDKKSIREKILIDFMTILKYQQIHSQNIEVDWEV